jgi:hypothetical protein
MPVRPKAALAVFALGVALSLAAACAGTPSAKDAHSNGTDDISIGETAVANGGIGAFGRSDAAGASETTSGVLRANLLDKDNPVKLDGVLDEWPARAPAKLVVKGTPGADLAFAMAIQYDDRRMYLAGEVADDSFVRTARFAEGEDHASLTLAFPSGGGHFATYEVGLFAGKPGESTGEVKFVGARRGPIPGSKIVEASTPKGYTFEAVVPWSAFPEARLVRVGLRGTARYYDTSGSAASRSILSTGPGDASSPAGLPPFLTEPELAIFDGILTEKALSSQPPSIDVLADITGDGMKERIAVWDRYLTICGPTYRGGKEYFYKDVGGELVHLEARDVTGRGKSDLIVRLRIAVDTSTRDEFEVWSVLGGDEPTTTFGHEIGVAKDGMRVSNAVRFVGREIEVSVEPPTGWDPSSYREPAATDMEPVLLPWGPTRSRTFRFAGTRFVQVREVKQTPAPGAAPQAVGLKPSEPPTPEVVRTKAGAGHGDLSAQLLDQYKRDRNVPPDAKPKVDLTVNVDGDAQPERVVLIGRDIVVFGPGFKGGNQYAFLTLQQFDASADVKDMTARDLTGEGGANVIVRGTRRVTSAGSREPIETDVLFVYQVKGGTIARVFAVETGRAQGGRRAQGMVQFIPSKDGRGFEVDVRPGRVTGWTSKTYPWGQDAPGAGTLEPLLLPWGGIANLRYAWNGTAFARP